MGNVAFEIVVLAFFALLGVFILKILLGTPSQPLPPPPPPPPYSPYMLPPPMPYAGYYPVQPKPRKKKVIILPESTIKRVRRKVRRRRI